MVTGILRSVLLAAFVATATLFVGCARPAESARNDGPIRIVCTTGMIADTVRLVAGGDAEVINLIGEGVDPHLYRPTATDLRELRSADVVFYNGLLLEGRMTDTFIALAKQGKPIFAVTELIDEATLLEPEDSDHWDPHVWMDVTAWSSAVDAIANALIEIDPQDAADYQQRAAAYKADLLTLHEYAVSSIASIPESQRVLITAHDAFNYFGRTYGIEVLGIQGLSTESEAGLDDINRLTDTLVARRVPAVFVESSVSDKNVRALIEGANARRHQVAIGGELFSDAMGTPGTYEGTYVGMIDHNVTIITRALGGDAPERGLHGRLSPEH